MTECKPFLFPGWGCLLAQRMCSLLKHTQHKHRHACRASSHIMPRHAGGLPILPMTHNHAHISCRHTSSPYSCARRPVVHRITFPRAAQKDDDSTRAAGITFVRVWGAASPSTFAGLDCLRSSNALGRYAGLTGAMRGDGVDHRWTRLPAWPFVHRLGLPPKVPLISEALADVHPRAGSQGAAGMSCGCSTRRNACSGGRSRRPARALHFPCDIGRASWRGATPRL